MATIVKSLSFLLLLPLLSLNSFIQSEARPFNIMMTKNSVRKGLEGFFDGLYLGAIKQSGPSPGEGHKFTDGTHTLGDMKESGPSPGQGNKYTNGHDTLGDRKQQSGPSPGVGHKFPADNHSLGSIKPSGPSPGVGHKYTKQSGPSPGEGH